MEENIPTLCRLSIYGVFVRRRLVIVAECTQDALVMVQIGKKSLNQRTGFYQDVAGIFVGENLF